jgi:hypothetical protein
MNPPTSVGARVLRYTGQCCVRWIHLAAADRIERLSGPKWFAHPDRGFLIAERFIQASRSVVGHDVEADVHAPPISSVLLSELHSRRSDSSAPPRLVDLDVPHPPVIFIVRVTRPDPEMPDHLTFHGDIEQSVTARWLAVGKCRRLLFRSGSFCCVFADPTRDQIGDVGGMRPIEPALDRIIVHWPDVNAHAPNCRANYNAS